VHPCRIGQAEEHYNRYAQSSGYMASTPSARLGTNATLRPALLIERSACSENVLDKGVLKSRILLPFAA
jgi:hypothetical protein